MRDGNQDAVRIRAHHDSLKRLGEWTTSRVFDVHASRSVIVLDLLLPRIEPGDIEIALDLEHATLKLLVPDGAVVDHDDLRRVGRGRVKDWTGASAAAGRRIKLVGEMRSSEVRIHRGGVAILSLMRSRKQRRAVRRAHRVGRLGRVA